METPLSVTNMFSNTITDPNKVFDSIKLKTSFMTPFMINILLAGISLYLYFDQIDPKWFFEYYLSILPIDLAPDQIEVMRDQVKPDVLKFVMPVVAAILILILFLIQSLVLHIIGNIKNMDVSYGEWFSLISWSTVPSILLGIMVLFNLFIGDNSQLRQEFINPISFATIFELELPDKFNKFMSMISIITFWNIYIVSLGIQKWSRSSVTASYIIALTSFGLIWAIQVFLL